MLSMSQNIMNTMKNDYYHIQIPTTDDCMCIFCQAKINKYKRQRHLETRHKALVEVLEQTNENWCKYIINVLKTNTGERKQGLHKWKGIFNS